MRFGGLIAAIVFAALAAILVLRMTGNDAPPAATAQATPSQQLKTVDIYVAALPIAVGSIITPDMLAVQPWPEHLVLEGFVRAPAAQQGGVAGLGGGDAPKETVIGNVARASFQQQEPIIASKLSNPNDPNFLAGALPKGMRVVTTVVNEVEGVAGFVFPGDHVDVLLTHTITKLQYRQDLATMEPKEDRVNQNYTETLLNNVVVVAVDQHSSSAGTTDKDGKLIIPRTVSLMVSPTDAQKIRLGQKEGTLTLSLRSLADKDSVDPVTVSGAKDISQVYEEPVPAKVGGSDVLVWRGTQSNGDYKRSAAMADFFDTLAKMKPSNSPTPTTAGR